jgi:outer membrane receptor protein involved in Fe transport
MSDIEGKAATGSGEQAGVRASFKLVSRVCEKCGSEIPGGNFFPTTGTAAPFPWRARKVSEWVTLDLIASYTFNLPPPASAGVPGLAKDGNEKNVMPVCTAEYNPCGWRAWLNNTTFTLGMQNVFDTDPPFVAGAFQNNYDQSLATIKGRFWYAQLKKRF